MVEYKADEDLTDEDLNLDEECGFSYDHQLVLLSEDSDGNRTFVCENCDAEVEEDAIDRV